MRLRFRRLDGSHIRLEVDPSDTIKHVRSILARDLSVPASSIRLVFNGDTLKDDQTTGTIQQKDTDFIILIQTKAPPTPPRPPRPPPPPPSEPPKPCPSPAPLPHPDKPSNEPLPQLVDGRRRGPPVDPANFAELVEGLAALGYDRDDCEEALRVADYSSPLAAELLSNGGIDRGPEIADIGDILALLAGGPVDDRRTPSEDGIDDDPAESPDDEEEEQETVFTEEEKAQMARLEELGFSRRIVIKVYRMCDKDYTLAATCLLAMSEN
jgi:type IV secretory pathway VirB10-like protein